MTTAIKQIGGPPPGIRKDGAAGDEARPAGSCPRSEFLPEQWHITGSQIAPDTLQPHGVAPAASRVLRHVDRDLRDDDRFDQPYDELLPRPPITVFVAPQRGYRPSELA